MNENQTSVNLIEQIRICRLLSVDSEPDGWPAVQMKTITTVCDGIDNQEKLITALDEYIAILRAELDEIVELAFAHGWRTTQHEQGEEMRKQIQQLRVMSLSANAEPRPCCPKHGSYSWDDSKICPSCPVPEEEFEMESGNGGIKINE